MPSTPVDAPFDFNPDEINLPDFSNQAPYFLHHQQIKNVLSTASLMEQQNEKLLKSFKMLNIGALDSSQTDHSSADDVSPKIQRRRKPAIDFTAKDQLPQTKKHDLPRLSISIDHHNEDYKSSPPSQPLRPIKKLSIDCKMDTKSDDVVQALDVSAKLFKQQHIAESVNKRIVKSASAIDLSLKISPNYNEHRVYEQNANSSSNKLFLKTHCDSTKNVSKSSIDATKLELDLLSTKNNSAGGSGAGNGGSSSASSRNGSSREASPSRESLTPLINNLKPPFILRRGPRGFGFTVHTIR